MPLPERYSAERPTTESESFPFQPSTIDYYLKDIQKYPRVSDKETLCLFRKIKEGTSALKTIRSETDQKNQQNLLRLVCAGEEAKNIVISANLRLVVNIAKRYQNWKLPFSDLVQEGNLGLIKAVDGFDPEKGFKFSTYAVWQIRQAIHHYLANMGFACSLPKRIYELYRTINIIAERLGENLKREPTAEDISREIKIKPIVVQEVIFLAQEISLEKPILSQLSPSSWLSEEELCLENILPDEESLGTEEQAALYISAAMINEVAENVLTFRERRILYLRYGLIDGQSYTLEEVGAKLGVTKARIQQIEQEALRKLRHSPGSKILFSLL